MESRSYAWKNKNELPNQIKKLREYPQVQGSVFFSSSTFNSNPNGWSDSLRNNYYKYPAIVPPMSWIDSIKPAQPEIVLDSTKPAIFDYSVDLYLKQDTVDNRINRYVIYSFGDTTEMDNSDPKNITEIIESGDNYYKFNLQNISLQQDQIVIAVTSLTNTNVESDLTRYLYLRRMSNGWHVISNKQQN